MHMSGPSHDHDHHDGHDQHDNQTHHDEHEHENRGLIASLFGQHSHGHQAAALDAALSTERGIRALKFSLAGLLITAALQVIIVLISGSVALLADTIHNFSDALTAIPLWLAFTLARHARNHRYTYGYGRAEDLAGAFIVVMIFGSAVIVFYESILKILNPQPLRNLGWVAAAAIIGFLGNELVALFRIRVGREIDSAALVADGLHSRADGFTSLGVLAGAIGVWLGFPLADPIVGIIIGLAILVIVWNSAREMWYRLMDATDPDIARTIEQQAGAVEGVMNVHQIAVRWVGHRLRAELHIVVDCQQPTVRSHHIAEKVRHTLFHTFPAMVNITVHVDPCECDPEVDYHPAAHHVQPAQSEAAR